MHLSDRPEIKEKRNAEEKGCIKAMHPMQSNYALGKVQREQTMGIAAVS